MRHLLPTTLALAASLALPLPAQEEVDFSPHGLLADSAPTPPAAAAPSTTTLPLELPDGARVAFVGNTLLDRARHFGHFESMLHAAFPGKQLAVRNFAWSADEPGLMPRPDNFASLDQHLFHHRADTLFVAFGFNESFAGPDGLAGFKTRLAAFLNHARNTAYDGASAPRIALLSPTPNQDVEGVPAATLNNENLGLYTAAMREVAAAEGVAFVDLFSTPLPAGATFNGVHLTDAGYRAFAETLFRATFATSPPAVPEALREAVVDKNAQYFRRYRPLNTFYYTGGRRKSYGYLDFLPAMRNFELMTEAREAAIWALAKGGTAGAAAVDDSALPPLPEPKQSRGANPWLSPADELKAFKIDPRFEVNCFASEEDFPDIACPVQMRWDARGRLWVACSTTYPHVYPGQEPRDKIVILEDRDGDGRADHSQVWADDVHIPLSFEFGDGGLYLSEEPDFTHLSDSDGDGRADTRRRPLTGFGCEDSHHALHDFTWTPDGHLLFRESIFHNSQVETPYGPVRAKNSAWFLYRPAEQRLMSFGSYPNTNPWGVTFDAWGRHVASHPIFANTFHATNPPYPAQHPGAPKSFQAYSGTCGQEFVDWDTFPEDLRGGFVKVRYKPTNRVEFHTWTDAGDHFREERQFDILFSTDLCFIPVDLRFGPRGALYVCDWYNPVKGHAQYSLRDDRRDRKSGRIWRITAKGQSLADPVTIAGRGAGDLLRLLERKEYRIRYWAKRELRDLGRDEVLPALGEWAAGIAADHPRRREAQLEALWLYRSFGITQSDLLKELLASGNPAAREAATAQLRHAWRDLGTDAPALLLAAAQNPHPAVRREAAVAASWIPERWAFDAVLAAAEAGPVGAHLAYAVETALGSANLRPFWSGGEARARAEAALAAARQPAEPAPAPGTPQNREERQFDRRGDLLTVTVTCLPERMLFDKTEITAKPGQAVKIILLNPDATMHNLVVGAPGSLEKIGTAANEMAKDPGSVAKHFIPDLPEVLHSTPQLLPGESHTLRFEAPDEPGTYPYLCTFPGHWTIMHGELTVQTAPAP